MIKPTLEGLTGLCGAVEMVSAANYHIVYLAVIVQQTHGSDIFFF